MQTVIAIYYSSNVEASEKESTLAPKTETKMKSQRQTKGGQKALAALQLCTCNVDNERKEEQAVSPAYNGS